jgi:DNA-binding beta-propeller fold protein YncE
MLIRPAPHSHRRLRLALPSLLLALGFTLAAGCGDPKVIFDEDDPWQSDSDWPGIGAGKVMVTNSGDDTLSFLDPVTLEPLYRASTGRVPAEREGPHHGAATPDGHFYFVGISNVVPGGGSGPHGSHGTGTVDGYLLRYECETNSLAGEVRVDRSPGDVRTTADGRFVLQTHFDLQGISQAVNNGEDPRELRTRLAVIEADTMDRVAMIPLCPAAHGMSLAPDGSTAYVTCWGSDELAIVPLGDSPSEDAEVVRLRVQEGAIGDPVSPSQGPYAATVSPDGTEVWVSNLEGKSLSVYDVATGAFDAERFGGLDGSPLFPTFSPAGDRLYVPVQNQDALVVVDTATGDVVSSLFFNPGECQAPHGTLLIGDGEKLGVVCEGDHVTPGTVVRVDLTPAEGPVIEEVFEVGVYPDDLVYIPEAS